MSVIVVKHITRDGDLQKVFLILIIAEYNLKQQKCCEDKHDCVENIFTENLFKIR